MPKDINNITEKSSCVLAIGVHFRQRTSSPNAYVPSEIHTGIRREFVMGGLVRSVTVKILIRAAFTALSLAAMSVAYAQTTQYRTPVHNYYQNNWMEGGGG